MAKKITYICILITSVFAHVKFAEAQSITTCINPVTFGSPYASVHAIASQTAVSACNSFFWYEPGEKEIFATALTAAINKKRVVIHYVASAGSISLPGFVTTTCRIRSIHIEFNQPSTLCSGL